MVHERCLDNAYCMSTKQMLAVILSAPYTISDLALLVQPEVV